MILISSNPGNHQMFCDDWIVILSDNETEVAVKHINSLEGMEGSIKVRLMPILVIVIELPYHKAGNRGFVDNRALNTWDDWKFCAG